MKCVQGSTDGVRSFYGVLADERRGPQRGPIYKQIEEKYPMWLHMLFRVATKKLTSRATWAEFVEEIYAQS